jgi:hypothetical protein
VNMSQRVIHSGSASRSISDSFAPFLKMLEKKWRSAGQRFSFRKMLIFCSLYSIELRSDEKEAALFSLFFSLN